MKTIIILLLVLVLSGCGATVKTYTFEKERVDQSLEGNRGYLAGSAPEIQDERDKTRTWVGIDIELPTKEEFIEETGLKWKKQ